MGNKIIAITSTESTKKTGLEVYRDISLTADLNQANILKSYREIIPIAYLSGMYEEDLKAYRIEGQISGFTGNLHEGFPIKMQYADTYYVQDYGYIDLSNQCLCSENLTKNKDGECVCDLIKTEGTFDNILLLKNPGEVSSMAEYREYIMWNPYKLAKLVNVKAVFNSLHNIFTWNPGERILNPEFGNNLRKYLYEGITDFTSEAIIAEIRRCISEYEPRVLVQSIKNVSNTSDTENNTIQLDIIFTIPTLSKEQFIYSYTYNQQDNQ